MYQAQQQLVQDSPLYSMNIFMHDCPVDQEGMETEVELFNQSGCV